MFVIDLSSTIHFFMETPDSLLQEVVESISVTCKQWEIDDGIY
jgi:hypothetical protein